MLVFVYGTLKKNEPNHHWLTNLEKGCSKFVSSGKLKNRYPLVIGSKYNIPFLLGERGIGEEIMGEVYEVDDEMLKNLDILESYPKLYTRSEEPVILQAENPEEDFEIVHAWTYFLKYYGPDLLNRPYLSSYSTYGTHGLPYIARYLRDNPELTADQLIEHSDLH